MRSSRPKEATTKVNNLGRRLSQRIAITTNARRRRRCCCFVFVRYGGGSVAGAAGGFPKFAYSQLKIAIYYRYDCLDSKIFQNSSGNFVHDYPEFRRKKKPGEKIREKIREKHIRC